MPSTPPHQHIPQVNGPDPTDRAASCAIRNPYGFSAPGVAEDSPGAGAAPGTAGPGVPTEEGAGHGASAASSRPARRRLRQPRLRGDRICPRYSPQEKQEILAAARRSGMPAGGFVAAASLAAARSDNPEAAVAHHRRTVRELMASNRQLAAIGNNVNQIARHLNSDGDKPALAAFQHLIALVEAAIAGVDEAVGHVVRGRDAA
ncbi:MobC family plasmid mobilization relaxosome protein [Streptomyces sp. YIM 98790]|uniref:MobC family plasmid mobilization relaxosome protein n=1 Tax=Streptomyces sp. YIM 98790 TaxID=2689077 RepID=UPI00140B8C63|nr:MobC family plasmid mobilization relaxosome protein [Streptomyces sp. YIM 98790]